MDLNKKIKDLDGKDFDDSVGEVIAEILAKEVQTDSVRSYNLALEIKSGKSEFNDSDKTFILAALEKTRLYIPLYAAQVLLEFKKDDKK